MAGGRPPQGLQGLGRARGVLAKIEPHGGKPEQLNGPAHGAHEVGGEGRAVGIGERTLHQTQIVHQFIGAAVMPHINR